mgnify:CR=1 FL=1
MHFYLNYVSKDFYSIYLLVFFVSIFLFKISNSTKLIYLFNRFVYSMTNFFPGINEEDKHTVLLRSNSLLNLFCFLFITSIISFTIDSYLNFTSLEDLLRIWAFIVLICISRYSLINFLLKVYKIEEIDIVFNKIYIITINTAFFLFIVNLINSYYFDENSIFLKVSSFIVVSIYMIAQLNNYLYIVRWGNIKNIIYFILYLCAFKLAPWIWLYTNILKE